MFGFPSFDCSAVDKVSIDVEFSEDEESGPDNVVSEHMVKRQPWFCWVFSLEIESVVL